MRTYSAQEDVGCTLDPVYSKSVEEVRAELRAFKESYVDMVLNNRYPAHMSVT
jgi:hypothetical protein